MADSASGPARRRKTQPAAERQTVVRRSPRRSVKAGDTGPTDAASHIEGFTVGEALDAAQAARLAALRDLISGVTQEESVALLKGLLKQQRMAAGLMTPNPDDELAREVRARLSSEPERYAAYTREYVGWGVFALMAR